MSAVVEVKNLTKEYKQKKAVDDLSFEIRQGEILGLLGPNGSGKSTTINCILSLLKYSAGSIRIFGEEMTPDAYKIKRDIGVIFQEVAVFEELTVYENIDYFCGLYVKDKQERKKDIEDAIALVGLDEFRKYYPKQLSGGLLRRLNIACGIAHKPKMSRRLQSIHRAGITFWMVSGSCGMMARQSVTRHIIWKKSRFCVTGSSYWIGEKSLRRERPTS